MYLSEEKDVNGKIMRKCEMKKNLEIKRNLHFSENTNVYNVSLSCLLLLPYSIYQASLKHSYIFLN